MSHPDNSFYGHRAALLRHSGSDLDCVINGHLQHGWMPGAGLMSTTREIPWIPKLVWNSRNASRAVADGHRRVRAVGAPFIYLPQPTRHAEPVGTLVYPHHSWEKAEMTADHGAYISELVEREGPEHTTVCLYWREFDDDAVRRSYESAGFQVICHGYRLDQAFLNRAHSSMLRHRRIVTNRVGTAVWYAAFLGRNVEVYGPNFSAQETAAEGAAFAASSRSSWPDLFAHGGVTGDQAYALGSEELGAEHQLSPAEVREFVVSGPLRRRTNRAVTKSAHLSLAGAHRLRTCLL